MTHLKYIALALPLAVMACEPTVEGSNRAADATQRAFHDTTNKWKGLFSYNPQKEPPQQPQSRYCYTVQTDIVCYDSPQPNMTAKLGGYQDGANISWFQPGGGSLGVSGGEPTANYRTEQVQAAPPQQVNFHDGAVMTQSTSTTTTTTTTGIPADAPFAVGESAYEKNAVISNEIAAKKTK